MTILFADACISASRASRTRRLAASYLEKLKRKYPDAALVTEDLVNHPYPPLTADTLRSRCEMIEKGCISPEILAPAERFAGADLIVIAAPYWDLSFPAELKAYIENIMINTVVFTYENNRPKGLCRAEGITYITTSGGYIGNADFGYEYIRAVGAMLGIEKCGKISAEGLDIYGADTDAILSAAAETPVDFGAV